MGNDLYPGEVVVSSPGAWPAVDTDAPEALARNPCLAFLAEALGRGMQTGRGWVTAVRTGRAYGYVPGVLEEESRTVVALRLDLPRTLAVAEHRPGGAETHLRLATDSWDDKVAELLSDQGWWASLYGDAEIETRAGAIDAEPARGHSFRLGDPGEQAEELAHRVRQLLNEGIIDEANPSGRAGVVPVRGSGLRGRWARRRRERRGGFA